MSLFAIESCDKAFLPIFSEVGPHGDEGLGELLLLRVEHVI